MIRTVIFVFMCVFLSACSGGKQLAVEQPPIPKPTAESTPVRLEVAQAPNLPEVQDAIKRIFKDAAVLDPNSKPNFLSGDFNGDASQDLAVILRPAPGKVAEMNEEYAPWLLRDPRASQNERRQQLRIEQDETVLAVIHGYGVNDWRDPEATQTFVLKNVVGSELRVQSGKEFVAANSGRKLPRPQGDLIGETLEGTPGYLYYATSTYSWYDPKTFKGQPQAPGVFHKSRTMRAHAQHARIGKPQLAHAEKPLLVHAGKPLLAQAEKRVLAQAEKRMLAQAEKPVLAHAKIRAASDGSAAVPMQLNMGWAPGSGSALSPIGQRPNQGLSPYSIMTLLARRSLASHPAAKPHQTEKPLLVSTERSLRAHAQQAPVIAMITAAELKAKINNNETVTIIDVRGSQGYAASRTTIKGAFHFKLRRLKSRFKFSPLKDLPRDREIVTYCACPNDESSISAAQIFQEAGFKRVKVLQGGWTEWVKNNGPVQSK